MQTFEEPAHDQTFLRNDTDLLVSAQKSNSWNNYNLYVDAQDQQCSMSDLPSPIINTAERDLSPSLNRQFEFSPLTRLNPIGQPAIVKVELRGAPPRKSYDNRNFDEIAERLKGEIETGLLNLYPEGNNQIETEQRETKEAE